MREELERRLRGRVAVVGVGNPMWGDDGAGPALILRLAGKVPALLVDGGEAPESYWGTIAAYRPEAVLVVDAVDWGGEPGSVAIMEEVEEQAPALSTHRIPLNLLLNLLRTQAEADVFALGIQPKVLAFQGGMSAEVQKTVGLLGDLLMDILVGGARC
jgi:hydrogenase maturation protease HycI